MTDAAYCLRETEKERKSLARMSRYKKSGSKTKYVHLPQTYMSEKEWKKMNSAVETFKLDAVMSKDEFKKLPDDIKREYILYLVQKYSARQKDIAEMLGYSQNGFWSLSKQLFGNKSPFQKGQLNPTKAWLNFINPPADDKVNMPDDKVNIPSDKVNIPDGRVVPPPDVKPEPVAPAINGNDYLLESYRVRYSGKPMLIFAEAMKVLDPNKDYVIELDVFNAHETPCTLPF